MVFKDDAKIDTSEVEDDRGSSGGLSGLPTAALAEGGGGIGLIVAIVLLVLNSGVLGSGGSGPARAAMTS